MLGYDDTLNGEAGNDTLDGGKDGVADLLFGNLGADLFSADWFTAAGRRRNRDQARDLYSAQRDRII